ncbi:MAG: CDP-glycerol glycerophosphotransferase family protein [Ruminococcaceae bacterium]|nr:CDP-glycerol glycerophosphotransferase family protein [Oscillospiraceae bacterium]
MTNEQATRRREHYESFKANSVLWQTAKRVYHSVLDKTNKVDDKLILFSSYFGGKYACNPRALYEQMLRDPKYNDYRFVWAFKKPATHPERYRLHRLSLPDSKRTKTVKYNTIKHRRVMMKAGYIITNSITPDYMVHQDGQVIVQTWHGTPLKRLGCDIDVDGNENMTIEQIHERYMSRARKYDYFLSPSDFYTEKLTSAFALDKAGVEDIILQKGYPRNDFLLNYTDEDVKRVKAKYGIPEDKKVILYAPTFRDNHLNNRDMPQIPLDFDRLKAELGDEYVILFRTHYLVRGEVDFSAMDGFVLDAIAEEDINDLYIVSDLLITDYSSVFFDFANLKRPVILFTFDLDEYADEIRGFYFDIRTLPFPIVMNQDELVDAVKNMDFHYDDAYKAFNEKFNPLEDGNSSARVLEEIIREK